MAERIGYNAIGVILKTDSPRNINKEQAKEIFNSLGPYTTKVCVTTTTNQEEINEILSLKPDAIQIYSNPENHEIKNTAIIQGIKKQEIEKHSKKADAILIDNSKGKGKPIDTNNLKKINQKTNKPLIISGGLNPDNIHKINGINPYGIDISSGVEEKPGKKNHVLLKKLHKKLRC